MFVSLCLCPFFSPHGTSHLPVTECYWNFIFEYFSKIWREISSFSKIWQEQQALFMKTNTVFMKTNTHFLSLITQFLLEWKTFETKVVDKSKNKRCVFNKFFIRKSYLLRDSVEKYWRAGQATEGSYGTCTLHAGCLSPQTLTQNTQCLLIFHCNNGCTNAP
jgi:hypothetical protein